MSITFRCVGCGQQYAVEEQYAGRQAKCRQCGRITVIPAPAAPGVDVLPPGAPPAAVPTYVPVAVAPQQVAYPYGAYPAAPADDLQRRARRENTRRTGRLIGLGIMLLLAFALPLAGPDVNGNPKFAFPNVEKLGDSTTSGMLKFMLAYPAIAGLLTIILAVALRNRVRGLLLLALGATPLVVFIAQPDVWSFFSGIAPGGTPLSEGLLNAALFAGGLFLLLLGTHARTYRPQFGWLYWLALAGTGMLVASQVLPVGPAGMPKQMPVQGVLDALRTTTGHAQVLAAMMVGFLGLLALAAVFAVLTLPPMRGGAAAGLSSAAFVLSIIALLTLVAAMLYPVLAIVGPFADGEQAIWIIVGGVLAIIKIIVLHIGGLALLFLAGAVDLIIGPPRRTPQAGFPVGRPY